MRHDPRTNVEVLPLTMVNMLQRMSSKVVVHDVTIALEKTQIIGDSDMIIRILYQYNSIIPKGMDVFISNLDTDTDSSEHCDERSPKLSRLLMKMIFGVLNLKIWSYQKNHNRFCN